MSQNNNGAPNDFMRNLVCELQEDQEERDTIFVDHCSKRERSRFSPLEDIRKDMFVIIRPTDEFEQVTQQFWLGRVVDRVVREVDHMYAGEFEVEWWRPVNRRTFVPDAERYSDCFNTKQVWERDPSYQLQTVQHDWILAVSSVNGWTSKSKVKAKTPIHVLESVKEYISENF